MGALPPLARWAIHPQDIFAPKNCAVFCFFGVKYPGGVRLGGRGQRPLSARSDHETGDIARLETAAGQIGGFPCHAVEIGIETARRLDDFP